MNILKRNKPHTPDLSELCQEQDQEAGLAAELLPLQFVEAQRPDLMKSRAAWTSTYKIFGSLGSDEMYQYARDGIDEFVEVTESQAPESQRRNIASLMVDKLSLITFVAARMSAKEGSMRSSLSMGTKLFDGLQLDAYHIATRDAGPMSIYAEAAVDMQISMKEADKVSGKVLASFTEQFAASPDSLTVLADLYADGVDKIDPGFSELQEVIRTDWHTSSHEGSVLRNFTKRLGKDPDLYLTEFVDKVIGTESDRKLTLIKNMARYALVSASRPDSDQALRTNLLQTRDEWGSFDDISNLFTEFKSQRLATAEQALDKIAGPAAADNPRYPKSPEDLQKLKTQALAGLFANRQETRKRNSGGNRSAVTVRPNIDMARADNSRFDRAGKPICIARNTLDSQLRREPTEKADLEAFVTSKTERHLVDDLVACIDKINENPFDTASRAILSGSAKVSIDGKNIRLRRYKPRHGRGLNMSQEAASWRICYGVVDGSVVITDILTHDQFTRKFK